MDGFKPINIDDFDSDFIQGLNAHKLASSVEPAKSVPELVPAQETDYLNSGRDSIIPEVFVEEKASELKAGRAPAQVQAPSVASVASAVPAAAPAVAQVNYFNRPAQDFSGAPASAPAPVAAASPASPVAAETPPAQPTTPMNDFIVSTDFSEDEPDNGEHKSSVGRLIAKIGVIFLLAVTIVSFVLGCFVTMFLDNRSIDIAGYSMCTVDENIGNIKWLRKGCLVVYKNVDIKDIEAKQIAIAFKDELPYFFAVSSPSMQGSDGEYTVLATQVDDTAGVQLSLGSEDVAGVAVRYIPHIAGMLTFAMNNAILVCALFILLVVFLGLIIVLIERTKIVA